MKNKKRLDVLLTDLGYAETRSKAQAVIMSGLVYVDGQKADKPGISYEETVQIEVRGAACPYVSRGGLKLEKALRDFGVQPVNYVCSDSGASTGGLDIPPLVLNKWFKLPVSATMLTFDIAVLLMQAVFSPVQQVLYGVVMVLIHTIVMDKMLMLGASRTEVKIVSSQSDAICAAILAQLDRGVTILHGEGGYTREPSAVLLSIVSNRELPRLEKLAHSIDPTCFLIVSHVTEVSGRGFSLDKDYL